MSGGRVQKGTSQKGSNGGAGLEEDAKTRSWNGDGKQGGEKRDGEEEQEGLKYLFECKIPWRGSRLSIDCPPAPPTLDALHRTGQ